MPKSLNVAMLIGNLGKKPEVKYTTSGTAVATFSMATTSSYKNKAGDWEDKTDWHNVTCWARLAEIAGEYLDKGSKVYISGRMETQNWEDKQSGKRMYKTQIVAQDLIMLDGKHADKGDHEERSESRNSGRGQDRGFDQSPRSGSSRPVTEEDPITSDDVPF